MLPDNCLKKDRYGCETITVAKDHLHDFPALIKFVRQNGYGARTGILKLRLRREDREDTRLMNDLAGLLNHKFEEKVKLHKRSKEEFVFHPQVQSFFKASVQDHVYQYSADSCTEIERLQFVKESMVAAVNQNEISDCCQKALERGGLDAIRRHTFEEIENSSTPTPELMQKQEEYQDLTGTQKTALTPYRTTDGPKLIYGAGINIDLPLIITGQFSMSNLNTIIDLLPEKHDGIASPYAYCGTSHTTFPWHIEDGGLFSLNYVISGAPKLWFVFPPECFGAVDCVAQSFNIATGHASCRALLADHKILVADPEYFRKNFGTPYTTVLQEPGDFLIVFPFALHSGMNLGRNYALAANFGDEEWIEEGLYAPICACNPHQVHLDFSPILKEYKPELLEIYMTASGSMFPPTHPREVRRFLTATTDAQPQQSSSSPTETSSSLLVKKTQVDGPKKLSKRNPKEERKGFKYRKLLCPECNKSFEENKMHRLYDHVKKYHNENRRNIQRTIKIKYPAWQPKTSHGFSCKICGSFRRGSVTQLKMHHRQLHANDPFEGGVKCER